MCERVRPSTRMREPPKGLQEIDTRPRIGKFMRAPNNGGVRSTLRPRAPSTSNQPIQTDDERKKDRKKQNCSKKLILFVARGVSGGPCHTVENLLFSFQFFFFSVFTADDDYVELFTARVSRHFLSYSRLSVSSFNGSCVCRSVRC